NPARHFSRYIKRDRKVFVVREQNRRAKRQSGRATEQHTPHKLRIDRLRRLNSGKDFLQRVEARIEKVIAAPKQWIVEPLGKRLLDEPAKAFAEASRTPALRHHRMMHGGKPFGLDRIE